MEGNKIRRQERDIDKKLNIKTLGIREWRDKGKYHRCEPTPYRALEILFDNYKLSNNDSFVDFGFGRGRVLFYVHDRFNINVTGVEAEILNYDEALSNLETYEKNHPKAFDEITLEYGLAENYEIKKEDNVFYFFNPFDITILEIIYNNIINSILKHPRDVDLLVYYSIPNYIKFLNNSKHFKLVNKLNIPDRREVYQQVLIYRYKHQE